MGKPSGFGLTNRTKTGTASHNKKFRVSERTGKKLRTFDHRNRSTSTRRTRRDCSTFLWAISAAFPEGVVVTPLRLLMRATGENQMKWICLLWLLASVVCRADDKIILPQDSTYQSQLAESMRAVEANFPGITTEGNVLNSQFKADMWAAYKKNPDSFKDPNWPVFIAAQAKADILNAAEDAKAKELDDKAKDYAQQEADLNAQIKQENERYATEQDALNKQQQQLNEQAEAVDQSTARQQGTQDQQAQADANEDALLNLMHAGEAEKSAKRAEVDQQWQTMQLESANSQLQQIQINQQQQETERWMDHNAR
jgi:hypothetical protein